MARVLSRPLTGVCVSVLLAGCQTPSTVSPAMNLSFAAPGAISALSSQFASAADPATTFAHGSAKIGPDEKSNLHRQAEWLIAHPEASVTLIARAGDRELAARRARTVETVLLDQGIDRSRIRLTIAGELAADGELKMADIVLTEVAETPVRREARPVLSWTGIAPSRSIVKEAPVERPTAETPPAPGPSAPETPSRPQRKEKRLNAGKGNGGEAGDPGKSGLHNRAGDD